MVPKSVAIRCSTGSSMRAEPEETKAAADSRASGRVGFTGAGGEQVANRRSDRYIPGMRHEAR